MRVSDGRGADLGESMLKQKAALCACAVATILLAHGARAQIATASVGRGYFGVSAGAVVPQDVHNTISGSVSASLDVSFKTGAAVSGFVGYHLLNQLAIEAEIGYAAADVDKVSGTTTGMAGSTPVGGHVNSVVGFVNLLWKPLGFAGLSPYLGGGVGVARTESTLNSVGSTNLGTFESRDLDGAAQAILGLDYQVSDHFAIGGRYRYVWIQSGTTASDGFDDFKQTDFTAHVVMLTGTFRF